MPNIISNPHRYSIDNYKKEKKANTSVLQFRLITVNQFIDYKCKNIYTKLAWIQIWDETFEGSLFFWGEGWAITLIVSACVLQTVNSITLKDNQTVTRMKSFWEC